MDRSTAIVYGLLALVLGSAAIFLYRGVREAADAAQDSACRCRYCWLRMSLACYHEQYQVFPPSIVTVNGHQHSWRVLLAREQLDGQIDQYDLQSAWDSPQNLSLEYDVDGNVFQCGWQRGNEPGKFANYVAVVGPHTVFPPTGQVTWADLTDGQENTGLLVEILPSQIHWMEPRDPTIAELIQLLDANAGTGHLRGPGILFADDKVYRIAKRIPDALLEAIFTIDQNDGLTRDELVRQGYLH